MKILRRHKKTSNSSIYNPMDIIGIIPARGGSKGVPRKNIKHLDDKPLIAHSIEVAQKSSLITDIVVTTDDDEIAAVSRTYGAEVIMRPPELARDDSKVMDAVRHVIREKEKEEYLYDLLILLEPTAPFRIVEDISRSVALLLDNNADSVATFSKTEIPPTRLWEIENDVPQPLIPGSDPFLPRQQQKIGYALNGLVYVLRVSMLYKFPDADSFLLGKKMAHITPVERAIDIDNEYDFKLAEFFINQNKKIHK